MNSGVCIKGSNYSASNIDFYGRLVEILQLEYPALPIKRTILFKCEWFDPIPNLGTRIHHQYNLVDVHHKKSYRKYDPFILTVQAEQVCYTTYPTTRRNPGDWWAICKIKARSIVEVPETDVIVTPSHVLAFQENIVEIHPINPVADDGPQTLIGEDGNYLDIDDAHVEEDNEQELIVESYEDEELDGDDLFDISDDD